MTDAPEAPEATSTRPYLIRALYEWCTDNGFTPYVAVAVNEHVQVPHEYVKDGEIVLNVSFNATTALKLGNDYIEFRARFGGIAREIMVPVNQVMAIYARENGQGMAFPPAPTNLVSVDSNHTNDGVQEGPEPPRPATPGPRPALKRVK
jgi:stringent starvation protein B